MHEEKTHLGNRPENGKAGSPAEWQVGDVILDTYEITALLGEGGQGKVYMCTTGTGTPTSRSSAPCPGSRPRKKAEKIYKQAETWAKFGLYPNIVYFFSILSLCIRHMPEVSRRITSRQKMKYGWHLPERERRPGRRRIFRSFYTNLAARATAG